MTVWSGVDLFVQSAVGDCLTMHILLQGAVMYNNSLFNEKNVGKEISPLL
jgi:hypothetical protein